MPHRTTDYPADLVYGVARRFFDGEKNKLIVEAVMERYPSLFAREAFTRERVYPTVREALRRGFMQLLPPLQEALRDELMLFRNRGDVEVLDVRGGPQTSQEVASAAARKVLTLIEELGRKRGGAPVHLGLGIGQSNKHLAKTLGALLRSRTDLPDLVVHALTTDHAYWNSMENPIAYFSYLRDALPDVSFVGLHATPFFQGKAIATEKLYLSAIERRSEIDIVVSSIASATDNDGYLNKYLKAFDWGPEIADLVARNWVGDMMLCPYNQQEPIPLQGRRPVTLFDFDELVQLAHTEDKHVVLMVAACGACGGSKVDALVPLLQQPELHTWNHLIVDQATARELVRTHRPPTTP
jgi:hypothetical protein